MEQSDQSIEPGSARTWPQILAVLAITAIVVILDQWTKHLVRTHIPLDTGRHLIPGLQLVHVGNTGVAFSLFSGGGVLLLIVVVLVLIGLGGYFIRQRHRPWLWLPIGLVMGGAVGNLIDRIVHGAVTDFIKVPDWPSFNLADSAITIGVIILIFMLGRPSRTSITATTPTDR